MSWVSIREDDEEQLADAAAIRAFSPIVTSKNAVQSTRLKIEVDNLKQYQQVVDYALRKAKQQIAMLQAENERLTVGLSEHPYVIALKKEIGLLHEHLQTTQSGIRAKDKIFAEKLKKQQSENSRAAAALLKQTEQKDKELNEIVGKLKEYRFKEFSNLLDDSLKKGQESKFDPQPEKPGKTKASSMHNPVIPPNLSL